MILLIGTYTGNVLYSWGSTGTWGGKLTNSNTDYITFTNQSVWFKEGKRAGYYMSAMPIVLSQHSTINFTLRNDNYNVTYANLSYATDYNANPTSLISIWLSETTYGTIHNASVNINSIFNVNNTIRDWTIYLGVNLSPYQLSYSVSMFYCSIT